jgi:CheY-like chemotaxis protein
VRILVVDDDAFLAFRLCDLLKRRGHQAEIANTGVEAIRLALERAEASERFDAILSNVHKPGVSGLRLVSRIRREEPLHDTAVVLMDVDEEGDTEKQAMEGGADLFIRKPAGVPEIVEAVLTMDGYRSPASSPESAASPPPEDEHDSQAGGRVRRTSGLKRGRIGTDVRRRALNLPPLPENGTS